MQRYLSLDARRNRRRLCCALLTALMSVTALLDITAAAQGNKPQGNKPLPVFELNKAEHDFGDVFIGEDIAHVFMVRNQGAAPLELSDNPIFTTGSPKVGSDRTPGEPNRSGRPALIPVALTRKASAPT